MRLATMYRRICFATVLTAATACGDDDSNGGNLPPSPVDLRLESVGNVDFPVHLTTPPGDPRLFVVEKRGQVRIYKDGAFLPEPFLDIAGLVRNGGEQGFLGLAFDPQYATTGRFFVSYTNTSGDNVVASYTVSAGNPDLANPVAESIRLTVAQPQSNHNGGHIVFGPDGFLYVGRGDGGGSGDPDENGQSRLSLLGKILRLDVSGSASYAIPGDNPYASSTAGRAEVWSYGLRNPWRFSFDRGTGDLYVADVGQDLYEEVNVSTAGGGAGRDVNYGWDVMEGRHCFEPSSGCDMTGLTLPVLEYDHDDGCTVIGGHVYRGAAIPALQGTYFYGDLCAGWIRTFRYAGGEPTEEADTGLSPGSEITAFGEDAAGELYVLASSGAVYRIVEQ